MEAPGSRSARKVAVMSTRRLSFLLACLAVAPLRALAQTECDPPSSGPDAIVARVVDNQPWGQVDGLSAHSVGTDICNVGDTSLPWQVGIAQNLYRLHDNRFEQIGMSWVKLVGTATNGTTCCPCIPSGQFNVLGVGCSDLYSPTMNGLQSGMGPRSTVDAFAGTLPSQGGTAMNAIERRLQVRQVDIDLSLNDGALFFAEAQLIVPSDVASGNALNNISYADRQIVFSSTWDMWILSSSGTTSRRQPAVRGWAASDPFVVIEELQIPNEGQYYIAHRTHSNANGTWHYEYALFNYNSHRSAGSFQVPIPAHVTVSNIGFHDVDYHSGEPYDLTDWPGVVGGGAVTWSTEPFEVNENANALRWGTLYNFRFDASTPPAFAEATIGLFRPGDPPSVAVLVAAPAAPIPALSAWGATAMALGVLAAGAAMARRASGWGQGPIVV